MHRDRMYATSFLLFGGGGVYQSAEAAAAAAATLTKCSTEGVEVPAKRAVKLSRG